MMSLTGNWIFFRTQTINNVLEQKILKIVDSRTNIKKVKLNYRIHMQKLINQLMDLFYDGVKIRKFSKYPLDTVYEVFLW